MDFIGIDLYFMINIINEEIIGIYFYLFKMIIV